MSGTTSSAPAATSSAAGSDPSAYLLPPSQVWDGNDGAWSTFVIRVGNPPQYFRVVPSTLGTETWVPIPDGCDRGIAWCGNARGVEPFNAGTSGPSAGNPNNVKLGSLDAGSTCTANKSPNCVTCVSINGHCTTGPCAGRTCCGDPPGECSSGGCNGVSGICTGDYIGCPCPGPDYNANNYAPVIAATSPMLAQGFYSNASTSWNTQGSHDITLQSYLNESSTGQYGLDSLALGAASPAPLSLDSSVIVGVPTVPFFLGKLGLKPSNTTGPNNNTASLLTQLYAKKQIPSLSYGYTAGALYKPSKPLGSLAFGGYDAARFKGNDLIFYIDDTDNLLLPIQSISANQTLAKNSTLLGYNVTALIDTTTPHMWLPKDACSAFEKAFGLTWDNTTNLYTVGDSAHQSLLNVNPQVTFTLGATAQKTINITLPYAAFDLQASQPIYQNGTNVFPLRRANSANQITLGRAFFQEAFLLVDYEAKNFSISQVTYPIPTPNLITINHHPTASKSSSSSSSLSKGAIAGISVGSAIGALLLILLLAFFCFKRRSNNKRRKEEALAAETAAANAKNMSGESHHTASMYSASNLSRSPGGMGNEKGDWHSNRSPVDGHSPNGHDPMTQHYELKGSDAPGGMLFNAKGGYFHNQHGDQYHSPKSRQTSTSNLSRADSLMKALPRTPVELYGSDVAHVLASTTPHKGEFFFNNHHKSSHGGGDESPLDGTGWAGKARHATGSPLMQTQSQHHSPIVEADSIERERGSPLSASSDGRRTPATFHSLGSGNGGGNGGLGPKDSVSTLGAGGAAAHSRTNSRSHRKNNQNGAKGPVSYRDKLERECFNSPPSASSSRRGAGVGDDGDNLPRSDSLREQRRDHHHRFDEEAEDWIDPSPTSPSPPYGSEDGRNIGMAVDGSGENVSPIGREGSGSRKTKEAAWRAAEGQARGHRRGQSSGGGGGGGGSMRSAHGRDRDAKAETEAEKRVRHIYEMMA